MAFERYTDHRLAGGLVIVQSGSDDEGGDGGGGFSSGGEKPEIRMASGRRHHRLLFGCSAVAARSQNQNPSTALHSQVFDNELFACYH